MVSRFYRLYKIKIILHNYLKNNHRNALCSWRLPFARKYVQGSGVIFLPLITSVNPLTLKQGVIFTIIKICLRLKITLFDQSYVNRVLKYYNLFSGNRWQICHLRQCVLFSLFLKLNQNARNFRVKVLFYKLHSQIQSLQ